MSVKDTTDPSQSKAVSIDVDLSHPPEKVWRALTDPELMAEWLLPVVNHSLDAGAAFQLKAPPQPGWDGVVDCRVLEVDPPRTLRYAWVVGDLDTVITFSLTPTASGTLLSLVQTGFKPEQKQNFAGARYGLKMMTSKLVDVMEALTS